MGQPERGLLEGPQYHQQRVDHLVDGLMNFNNNNVFDVFNKNV